LAYIERAGTLVKMPAHAKVTCSTEMHCADREMERERNY